MHRDGYSLADYHIHPDFSFDAIGSVDDYCKAAIEKDLSEICFTTHYDTGPAIPEKERMIRINGRMLPHSIENIGFYVDAVSRARETYYPPLVRCGIEVGYYPGCEEEIGELFRKYSFHYKLGAVHDVGDINICYRDQMEACSSRVKLEDLADEYFSLVKQAVESGLFDAIAHMDIYKRYGLTTYGDDILRIHRGRIEPVFEAMVDADVGLEINTSSLRKGHKEYYPSMEIVNMARKAGVQIVAIGSDAHRPDDLAFDFELAASLAYELFPYCGE